MGKRVPFLTSQAMVSVHQLSRHFHFQLTHNPLSPDTEPGERGVVTLPGEAQSSAWKAISLCPVLPPEILSPYLATSNKQTHIPQRNIHVPTFPNKWTKVFKISQVRRKNKAVMYANRIPQGIFLGVYWLTCLSV